MQKLLKPFLKLCFNSFVNWVKDAISAFLMDECLADARCRSQSELILANSQQDKKKTKQHSH